MAKSRSIYINGVLALATSVIKSLTFYSKATFYKLFTLTMMQHDLFNIVGAPARLGARILLFDRYLLDGYATLRQWSNNRYARTRFGPHYGWRPWLLFDVDELKRIERLVNDGSDDDLLKLRDSQLSVFQLVAIVIRP